MSLQASRKAFIEPEIQPDKGPSIVVAILQGAALVLVLSLWPFF